MLFLPNFFTKIFCVACVFSALSSLCFAQDSTARDYFGESKLAFIEFKFFDSVKRINSPLGAMCLVKDGEVALCKTFSNSKIPQSHKNNASVAEPHFPLGQASSALISLLGVAMEKSKKLSTSANVSDKCSFFRGVGGAKQKASFSDLLSCKAGVSPTADKLIPQDSSSREFFETLAQIPQVSASGIVFERSRSSVAVAGYAMGYVENPRAQDMKKSFAFASKKYLFAPLGMSPRYRSFNKATFPATAFSLTIGDVAKWLCEETTNSPKTALRASIVSRRVPELNEKFASGFFTSFLGKLEAQISADYFENTACVIAVFPRQNVAVAFFVESKNAVVAPRVCVEMLDNVAALLSEISARNSSNKNSKKSKL